MYEILPSFILGFHGCDRSLAEQVFAGEAALAASENAYDWLGHGIYFWENAPERAMAWARQRMKRASAGNPIREPAVVGAVIDLGRCLNLLDTRHIQIMKSAYTVLQETYWQAGDEMPVNRRLDGSDDLLIRHLDCAVIQLLHIIREEEGLPDFQSVRGAFIEGPPIYPGAGVNEFNHIQVCVRDLSCIKGYFRVLPEPESPKMVRR